MKELINRAEEGIEYIKGFKPMKNHGLEMAKRIIISSVPLVLVSFVIPKLMPVIQLITPIFLYLMVEDIQEEIIKYDQVSLTWSASFPIYTFFALWCLLLSQTGKTDQLAMVASYFLLCTACLWPTYVNLRKHVEKKQKSPFKALFTIFTCILGVQQISIFF